MAAKQQGQRFVMSEEKRQRYKLIPTKRLIIGFVLLVFALSAVILLWHGTLLGSWSNVLIVIFSVFGIGIAFAQWLFPVLLPSESATSPAQPQKKSSYVPQQIIVQVPQFSQTSLLTSSPDETAFRGIIGLPPPTDPKTIEQRQKVVDDLYTKLIQPDTTAIALTGIGGIGKSTLAALVYRHAEAQRQAGKGPFTAQAIWLDIDPAVTLADLAGNLFQIFDKSSTNLNLLSPQHQAVVLFNLLNTATTEFLVILDQFDNLLDWRTGHVLTEHPGVGEWLDIINSQPCRSRILLTSRLWPRGTHEYPPTYMQEYPIGGLEAAEGIELLRKQGVQATEVELRTAVQRCGGHSLALTLLASLLRRNRSLNLTNFFIDSTYTQLWTGDIAHNLLDYIYKEQLDEVQRKLLLAFSIYREAVSLDAVQKLLTDISKTHIVPSLDVLLVQHLLQATGDGHYQLNAIVASYAQAHFDETDEQANQQALQVAHARAAQYYLSQAALVCPPRKERRGIHDVHPLLEAVWHQCLAGQWQDAYHLMEKEGIFEDLKRWGANTILFELYQLLLPLNKWRAKSTEAICIYNNLGRLYRTLGKREQARDYLENALSICGEIGDRKAEGSVRSFLGNVYADLGQMEQAQEEFRLALKIRREIKDREGEGWTLSNLGRLYDEFGQHKLALEYCELSLRIFREIANLRGQERTLNVLGRIYDDLGQKEQARGYYEQSLRICREIRDRLGEGLTLNGLGLVYASRGDWEDALQYFKQALEIRREVGDRGGEGRTLINLGRVYRILGQREQALAYLEQALSICREIGDPLGEGQILNNLGLIYHDRGEIQQALAYLEQALRICRETADHPGEGWALHNLGRVYAALGQKEQAQEYYEQALHIRKKVEDRRGIGWTLLNLGLSYFEQHRYAIALSTFLVARRIFEEVQSPAYLEAQNSIDNLREEIGEEEFTALLAQVELRADQIVEQALLEKVR